MSEHEFTRKEIERHDEVDNAIYDMVYDLGMTGGSYYLAWDMEWIGRIRDIVQEVIVDKERLMTEEEFYPIRGVDEHTEYKLDEEELLAAVNKALYGLDADDFSRVAGELIGGECFFINGKYTFVPNENYMGAFDTEEPEDDYNVGE